MIKSGIVDIQSHSMSHTWHITNNEVIDVLNLLNFMDYPWIIWDSPKIKKAYYLDEKNINEFFGLPIFSNEDLLVYEDIFMKMKSYIR